MDDIEKLESFISQNVSVVSADMPKAVAVSEPYFKWIIFGIFCLVVILIIWWLWKRNKKQKRKTQRK